MKKNKKIIFKKKENDIKDIDANCNEILQLAKKYNFKKVRIVNPYMKTVYIQSQSNDEWFLQLRKNKIVLLHQNTRNSHRHLQRQEWNWNYLFNSIQDHDKFKYGIN